MLILKKKISRRQNIQLPSMQRAEELVHSGESGTIREANQASGVRKAHYA